MVEKNDVYKFGVEFEMDAFEAGPNADLELKYYLNPEKTCYFKFDGNKTLEFVTEPYEWNKETSAPDTLFKDLLLAEQNLDKLYQGTNDELVKAARTKEKIRKKDENSDSIIINSYWPIGVPQITFQIPMHQYENLRNFAKSILKSHSFSFNVSMPNISSSGTEMEKYDLEIKGLAYLCIVTIRSLRVLTPSSREVGPKSCLIFMSRLPFRSMYLSLAKEQRGVFDKYIQEALKSVDINLEDTLFKDYLTALGKGLSVVYKGRLTVQNFIDSITKDNYDYSFEVLEGEMEIFSHIYQKAKRDPNKTDLLSPPPFMEDKYSMGALKDRDIRKHFVLEFRAPHFSFFYDEELNKKRWVLSSSAEETKTEEIKTNASYFYHSMIQSFEKCFIADTELKKIGQLDIKPISWVLPHTTRNLLWQSIVIIRRRKLYTGGDTTVMTTTVKLIEVLKKIPGDLFTKKFSEIFENFNDEAIKKQVKFMNDSDQDNFCSIATELLLEYDSYLSKYLSVFKSKDNK